MKYYLYKKVYENKAVMVAKGEVKGSTRDKHFRVFETVNQIIAGQAAGGESLCDSGIRKMYGHSGFQSSLQANRDSVSSRRGDMVMHEAVISGSEHPDTVFDLTNPEWGEASRWWDNDGNTHEGETYGVVLYDTGYVLNVGKRAHNALGFEFSGYLGGITVGSSKIHYSVSRKENAQLFETKAALLKWLTSSKAGNSLYRIADKEGWELAVESANAIFEIEDAMERENLKPAKLAKLVDTEYEINRILTEINEAEGSYEPAPYIPAETVEAEIENRMKRLRLSGIGRVRQGKLYMSRFSGILYDLDDGAKEAVEQVKKMGLVPYHVVTQDMKFGPVYSVLYISPEKSDWALEQWDEKEKTITTATYIAADGTFDYGDITVEPMNGGLMRVG